MTQDTDHRMSLRFGPDDHNWIAKQAADEGVDNATMVRMIINRLRRGRAPLISMMEAPQQRPRLEDVITHLPSGEAVYVNDPRVLVEGVAEDVLAQRLAEIDQTGGGQVVEFQPQAEAAAMPIRRVERERYNPGRK